jgi:hypothetical protein
MARRHPLDNPSTAGLVNLVSIVLGATLISGVLAAVWRGLM